MGSLVDDFDAMRSTAGFTYAEHAERFGDEPTLVIEPTEQPLLAISTTVRQASRGRGQVVAVAAASDHVFVATSRGYVLQYSWDDYGNEKITEVEILRAGSDSRILGLWVDPTACHCFVSARVQGVPELHYLHRRWQKARSLAKLRGITITAVGWPQPGEGGGSSTSISSQDVGAVLGEHCTGPVLLGTDQGLLHEMSLDERAVARKDPGGPRQLLDLRDRRKAICGIYQASLGDDSKLVVLATPLALYAARGPPGSVTLESVFLPYTTSMPLQPALEAVLPALSQGAPSSGSQPLPHSTLSIYDPGEDSRDSVRFGWLVGSMVYHGDLVLPSNTSTAAGSTTAALQSSDLTQGSQQQLQQQPSLHLSGEGLLKGVTLLPLLDPAAVAPTPPGLHHQTSASSLTGLGTSAGGGALSPSGTTGGFPGYTGSSAAGANAPLSPKGRTIGAGMSGAGGGQEEEPRAMVMTEFHFIVLAGDRVRAVNRVSGRCVSEMVFRSPLLVKDVTGEGSRAVDGLTQDPTSRTIYMYSDEGLYEVQLQQEARDMWRVFLEQRDWEAALRQCSSNTQRDEVHRARAEAGAAARDWGSAAVHWAKIVGGVPPFEEITLRLVEAEVPQALMLFLTTRLSCLGRNDRAQATMVAAWLTELQLDQINELLLQAGGAPSPAHAAAEAQLRDFLKQHVDVLDVGTTVSLLGAYGRLEDLLVYAQARNDHEAVLEALLQRPDGALRALAILRKPSCPQALLYNFAPALVAAAPSETVDQLITARPALEPRRLIPAMLRFAEPGAPPEGRRAVLRYVEYVLDVLGSQDSAVHNLAAALHSLSDDEAGLLSYLARARNAFGRPLYDPKYVLRLALERGRRRAAVKLLCELGMYDDAVSRALDVDDLDMAKTVAGSTPEDDEALRRRLWLAIAQHVVQKAGPDQGQAAAIKQAVEFLKEAGGLLKIEDVLPFFPDFVVIDNFRDAICDSLERYNKQIEELKREMEEATEIADAVRADLKVLGSRAAVVAPGATCARCGRPLPDTPPESAMGGLASGGCMPPFLVFPTGLAYHGVCCAAEVCELAAPPIQQRVRNLVGQLSRRSKLDDLTQSLASQLMEDIAAEDPRSGDLVVQLIDSPYVLPGDRAEAESWAI